MKEFVFRITLIYIIEDKLIVYLHSEKKNQYLKKNIVIVNMN